MATSKDGGDAGKAGEQKAGDQGAGGKETLTGDEGKNTPAPKGDENVDTGGDKPGAKAGEQKDGKSGDTGDKKADEAQKGNEGKDGDQPKAPDKYELKLPDDAGDYLDESDLAQVERVARAKGWTNEQAQASLEEYADSLAAQSQAFRVETEKDQTYGGDNLAETQRLARLALDKVRPANTEQGKALRRILAKSGYGNKLEVVSFLADLGKLMAEDNPGGSGAGSKAGEKSTADLFYGETSKGE